MVWAGGMLRPRTSGVAVKVSFRSCASPCPLFIRLNDSVLVAPAAITGLLSTRLVSDGALGLVGLGWDSEGWDGEGWDGEDRDGEGWDSEGWDGEGP